MHNQPRAGAIKGVGTTQAGGEATSREPGVIGGFNG